MVNYSDSGMNLMTNFRVVTMADLAIPRFAFGKPREMHSQLGDPPNRIQSWNHLVHVEAVTGAQCDALMFRMTSVYKNINNSNEIQY